MTIAFVLSGGGSLGAVQVGMLQALLARGIRPDVVYGTSVGAVNAAYLAGPGDPRDRVEELARLWRSMRRRDVFAPHAVRGLQALAGRQPSLFSDRGLRLLLAQRLGYADFAEAALPLRVVTTDLTTGAQVVLDSGDVVGAVCASAAVPGVLPPVERGRRLLVDGGIGGHRVLTTADADGVDEIYLLPAGYPCERGRAPLSALGIALQSLTLLLQQQLMEEVARYDGSAHLRVLPPLCPLTVGPADFGHTDELVDRARAETGSWLDAGGHLLARAERFLGVHDHGLSRPAAVNGQV